MDSESTRERQHWMRVLARANRSDLEEAWELLENKPSLENLRGPEAGILMVRGRIDAAGARFNLGEATVTRAVVRLYGSVGEQDELNPETVGHAYVLGSDLEHARLAAVFDALLADPRRREHILTTLVAPLERRQIAEDANRYTEAQETRVDFFTVAREHV